MRRSQPGLHRALLVTLLIAAFGTRAQAAVYVVGSGAGCTHGTIQAAIDAASASAGPDIIRVTRGTYAAQRLVVNDASDLGIEGGFLECATLVRVDHSTLDGQAANPPGPVIRHSGTGRLTLADLHIRNGVAWGTGAITTLGGGISSPTTGDLTVYRSVISGNRARNGAGLFATAPPATGKMVTLDAVSFYNNEAEESGGGIVASGVTLIIRGNSSFAGNHADGTGILQGGGALFAMDSSVFVNARPMPSAAFMDSNWSESNGGAIFFASLTSGARTLSINNAETGLPLTISYNTAARLGGAIYMRATATGGPNTISADLLNAVVSDNRAPQGGAFYLLAYGSENDNQVLLSLNASWPGDYSPPCPAALRCNRVNHNFSNTGATIVLDESGARGATSFQTMRGHLVDNIAISGGGLIHGSGHIFIDNSVLANNDTGVAALIDNTGSNETRVQNSTIASNMGVSPALFRMNSAFDDLFLHNSIAYQPGVAMLQVAAGSSVNLRNLLVGSGHGLTNLAARNIGDQLDPMFVNPGQGNFQLQPGSQARNRWSPGGGVNVPTVDLLGALRPAPPSGPTPYDFGAYEYGAVVDLIFSDSFDRN